MAVAVDVLRHLEADVRHLEERLPLAHPDVDAAQERADPASQLDALEREALALDVVDERFVADLGEPLLQRVRQRRFQALRER